METLSVSAVAKINLGLEVLGKRPDGYHEIRSLFVGITLADHLEAESSNVPTCICEPAVTESPEDNLVYKAMMAYHAAFPLDKRTAKITVRKRIPFGAGLGGGSSNAAAALQILCSMNNRSTTGINSQALHTIAATLGSDVPFFLDPYCALVEGRGERISPVEIHLPFFVLLVCPGIHVNTAHAYSTLGISGAKAGSDLVENLRLSLTNNALMQDLFTNDFERTVFAQHPEIASIKQTLLENGATYASMSGSGSSVYGLFTTVENAEKARSAFPSTATYICRPLQRTTGALP